MESTKRNIKERRKGGEKSRMGRVRKRQRQKGDQRKNRAGKSTAKERDVPLLPMREKLVFRCKADKIKPNKKRSKRVKIHKMGEGTRGRRIQIDMKRRKYIKYMDGFYTMVQPILNSIC